MEDFIGSVIEWIIVILFVGCISLAVAHGINPKNKVSRSLEAFFTSPPMKKLGYFLMAMFWIGILALMVGYYVEESGWYPRAREIHVHFKPYQWITGELATCHSYANAQGPKDDELTSLYCSSEDESHMLRVRFWGPINADRDKLWECEREVASVTCKLQ
jgi:hypothetical protein